jgi:hypothetical protein
MIKMLSLFLSLCFLCMTDAQASALVYNNSNQGLTVSGFVANVSGTPVSSDTASANVTISANDGTNNCNVYAGSLSGITINNGDFNLVLNSGSLPGTYTSLSQVLDSSNASITGMTCTSGASPVNGTLARWQVNISNLVGTATYIGATPLVIPITGVPFAQVSQVAQSANALGGYAVDLTTTAPTTASVLGFNGTKWVPTFVMSGSGTANYLSKFTGPTALTNSSIYDNGASVGIGTTAPTHPLEVNSSGTSIYGNTTAGDQFTGGVTGNSTSFSAGVYGASVYGSGVIGLTSSSTATNAAVLAIHNGAGPALQAQSSSGSSGLFQSGSNSNVVPTLVTKAITGSNADLFQVQNSSGISLVRINSQGYVGIAMTTSPSTPLQVAGEISPAADSSYSLGDSTHRFSNVYSVNASILTSDAREKKNILPSDLGLEFINQLKPVSYVWKSGKDTALHYGLIAQDTAEVISTLRKDSTSIPIVDHDLQSDKYGIRYTELISPLIKAVQEISTKISELTGQGDQQQRDLASLKAEAANASAKADRAEKELANLKAYLCLKDPRAELCK